MKKLLLLLLPLLLTAAEIDYMVATGFVYDGNIAQNTNEESMGYVAPEMSVTIDGEAFFVKLASDIETHIVERSPVLNAPLLSLSGGGEWGSKSLRFTSALRASLYYGRSQQKNSDGTLQAEALAPARNSYRWYNTVTVKRKKFRLKLPVQMQKNDYGENGKDGFRLLFSPELERRLPRKRGRAVQLRTLSLLPEYEGNFVKKDKYGYNYLALGAAAGWKLGRNRLSIGMSVAAKHFIGRIEHPHSEELIDVSNRYFYNTAAITVPVIADLDLKLNGKLRFKGSDHPGYAFNRHTFGVKLVWRSTIGKKIRAGREPESDHRASL